MLVVPFYPTLPPVFQGSMFFFVRPSGFQGLGVFVGAVLSACSVRLNCDLAGSPC